MPLWRGIVGEGFTAAQLEGYAAALAFGSWRPRFVVLHNTRLPTLAQWHERPGLEHLRHFERRYRDELGWSAGPHLFVADDLIWVFTPLDLPGVHSPSWNTLAWGVEVVGDYDSEPLSAAVRANTVAALATLHAAGGLDPASLRLHREDPRTSHTFCPGANLASQRDDIVAEVHGILGARGGRAPGAAGDAAPPPS
ncbi:MAG TPA: N-acetylmuramoyl-L-alanine amidase [Longimicrobiales bacterium]